MIALASVSVPREAEGLLRRALASPSMNSQLAVPALSTLGDLHVLAAGDHPGAASCWRLAPCKHAELAHGSDSDEAAKILFSLSQAVEPQESVKLLERALAIAQHAWGETHPVTATCEINLAISLLKAKRPAVAAVRARQGLAGMEAALGPRHPRTAVALSTLAEAMRAQGDLQASEALHRRALEINALTNVAAPARPQARK